MSRVLRLSDYYFYQQSIPTVTRSHDLRQSFAFPHSFTLFSSSSLVLVCSSLPLLPFPLISEESRVVAISIPTVTRSHDLRQSFAFPHSFTLFSSSSLVLVCSSLPLLPFPVFFI